MEAAFEQSVPAGAGGGAATQDMVADQPEARMEPSESKSKVRQPFAAVDVTLHGGVVPANVPINGAPVVFPL